MVENNAKLDWMYKGAGGLVDREEYLLGRTVDKTLEQLNNEEKEKKLGILPPKNHVEHECIPPSIRDFNKIVAAEQVDLSAKLQEDPLVAIKKREEEARRQFLQNPVQLKKLQEALKAQEIKKKKKKRKTSASDSDLDKKIIDKLKRVSAVNSLQESSTKKKKKSRESILDTILMHKFNELKDRLTEEDMKDIMEGRLTDESDGELHKIRSRSSNSSESENEREYKEQNRFYHRQDKSSACKYINKKIKNNMSDEDKKTKKRSQGRRLEQYSDSDTGEERYRNDKRRNRYLENEGNNRKRRKEYDSSEADRGSKKNSTKDRRQRSNSSESESEKFNKNKALAYEKKKYRNKSNTDFQRSKKYEKNFEFKNDKTTIIKQSRSARTSSSESSEDKEIYERHRMESNKKTNKKRGTESKLEKQKKAPECSDSSSEYIKNRGEKGKHVNKKQYRRTKHKVQGNRDLSSENSSSTEEETHIGIAQKASKYKKDSRFDDRTFRKPKITDHCERHRDNSLEGGVSVGDNNDLDKLILDKLRSLRNTEKEDNHTPPRRHSDSESEQRIFSHIDSDNDEPVYRRKTFGLVSADGTKIPLKRTGLEKQEINILIKKNESIKKPERKNVKKLSEKEKEQLRKQMMKDAEVREHERSQNLRKYREENKEQNIEFDKNFVHKELVKSTQTTSVEERIKSKLNNIQRSSIHMNSNFTKRY